MRKLIIAIVFVSVSQMVFAKGIESTAACTPGTWCNNLGNVQKYAKQTSVLAKSGFFIWNYSFNDGSCKHCDAADSNVYKKGAFKNWSKNNSIPILHAAAEDYSTDASKKFLSYYTSGGVATPTFVVVDGRDGVSRFGTCTYASGVQQNKIYIESLNMDSFLEQVHAMLDHADDVPYSSSKNGSRKLLNPQAREVTVNAKNAESPVVNGIWNSYGTNTLNCIHYWNGKKLLCTYNDRYDWFTFENPTQGASYRLVADVNDPKGIGKLCIFPSFEKAKASASSYAACLSNATEVVDMVDLKSGYTFTPAQAGAVYMVFTRRAALSNDYADYEDIEITYTFTLSEAASTAYYFDPGNGGSFKETDGSADLVLYRTTAGVAEDVPVAVDASSTAKQGVDYSLPATFAHFDEDATQAVYSVSILPRTGVVTLSRELSLSVDSPADPPSGCAAKASFEIVDDDVDVAPDSPKTAIVLDAGMSSPLGVALLQTNAWFRLSADSSKLYDVVLEPKVLADGDYLSVFLCRVDGTVVKKLGTPAAVGSSASLMFAVEESGDVCISVYSSKAAVYDIYKAERQKPTVKFSDASAKAGLKGVAAPTGQGWFELVLESDIETTTDVTVVVSAEEGDGAVAGEDFVAETNVVSISSATSAETGATLLRAPGFRGSDREFTVSIQGGKFYLVGGTAAIKVKVLADSSGCDDGKTPSEAHALVLDADHGTTNWLSAGVRKMGGARTNDWLRFSPISSGKYYRLAADGVSLVPAGSDAEVAFYTNGAPCGVAYSLSCLATNTPCFSFPDGLSDAQVSCLVSRELDEEGYAQYELKLREWVRPVMSFTVDKDETDDTNSVYVVSLTRTENTTFEDVVYVNCTVPADIGESMDRVEVPFYVGDTEQSCSFSIASEGNAGLWTGDRTVEFTLDLAEPESTSKGVPETLTLTLRDTDTEFETGDSASESAEDPLVSDEIGPDGVTSSRTLHGSDVEDWFVFANASADTTYRFQLLSSELVNVSSDAIRVVIEVPGAATVTKTFAELSKRVEIPAAEAGDIRVRVFRADTSTAEKPVSVSYVLEATKWQRARFSFDPVAYSVSDTNSTVTIAIRRQYNSEADNIVLVSTKDGTACAGESAPSGAYEALVEYQVDFPAGEANDVQTFEVALIPELDGYWTGNRTFTVVLAVNDESIEQVGEGVAEVELLDADEDASRKYDAQDMDDANSTAATVCSDVTKTCFSTTGTRRLNDDDLKDWYRFDGIKSGQNYRFGITGLRTLNADDCNLSVSFYVDDATLHNVATNISLSALAEMTAAGEYICFKPGTNKPIYACVSRDAADGRVSVSYEIVYREAPPSTVRFVATEAVVSELAAAVYVDVACEVEPGQTLFDDAVVKVTPVGGTAVAPYDFCGDPVYVTWHASQEDESTGGVKRVAIPLSNLDSEWEGEEQFTLELSSESDTEVGNADTMTITLTDKDAGAYGTVGITMTGDTNGLANVTSKTVQKAREGDKVVVRVSRVNGKRGAVRGVWKWMSGKKQVGSTVETKLFDGASALEPDYVDVVLSVPVVNGYQPERTLSLKFSIKAASKTVSLTKGTPTALSYKVIDKTFAGKVAAYSASSRANVPFRASGTSWYLAVDGSVRSQTPSAGGRSLLSTTVTGPGTLRFDVQLVDAANCTLTCKAGSFSTNIQNVAEATVSIPIAAGRKSVSVEFSRPKSKTASASASACAVIDNVEFIPADEFRTFGTFEGPVTVGGVPGRGTFSVSTRGKMSGKFVCPGRTLVFASSSGWGEGGNVSIAARSGGPEVVFTVNSATGVVTVNKADGESSVVSGTLYRNCWGDIPLTASAADGIEAAAGYYTVTLPKDDSSGAAVEDPGFGSGYLGVTIGSNGRVRASGVMADGQSVVVAGTLFDAESGLGVYLFAAPSAYRGGWVSLPLGLVGDSSPLSVVRESGEVSEWLRFTSGGDQVFDRRLAAVGGFYDTTANLLEFYSGDLSLATVDSVSSTTIGGDALEAEAWAAKDEDTAVSLQFNSTGRRLVATCAGDRLFTVSLAPATGIFKGSFRAQYKRGSRTITKSFSYKGMLTPVKAADDGIAGRGYFLMPEKDESGASVKKSYDIVIEEAP